MGDVLEPVGFKVVDAGFAAEEVLPPPVVELFRLEASRRHEMTEAVF
jgi:hypothetical protein